MSKVITAETFKEWMLINKPSILLLQSYHHSKEKIACKCKICGNVWSATPNCLKRGRGCPRCARQNSAAAKLNKGRNTFYSRIKERADITLLEEYTGSKKPISVKCTNCGYVWNPSAHNLQNGTGCPRCAQKLSPTNEEFMKWMDTLAADSNMTTEDWMLRENADQGVCHTQSKHSHCNQTGDLIQ